MTNVIVGLGILLGRFMIISNNNDLKSFVDQLISKLEVINELSYANSLRLWKKTSYTTSIEYLGELKLMSGFASDIILI
ncbi:MAG: hypothetical protein NUK65_03045 [Firmicutes bacterium]|nr:hypothetical protein [Bacillota bacterium]